MSLVLYDLCGSNDLRFSPYCWRTKLALKHKGLEYETVPVAFTDKPKIEFSGQEKVPVIDDAGTIVFDSWSIAEYLEDTYPSAPALFPGARGRQYAKMTNDWADALHSMILRCIIVDIHDRLDAPDRAYFRQSREQRFGATLEDLQAARDETRRELSDAMASMRVHLMDGPFVCGEAPAYGDFIVFGSLRWAECCSDFPLLDGGDPIAAWYRRTGERMGVF